MSKNNSLPFLLCKTSIFTVRNWKFIAIFNVICWYFIDIETSPVENESCINSDFCYTFIQSNFGLLNCSHDAKKNKILISAAYLELASGLDFGLLACHTEKFLEPLFWFIVPLAEKYAYLLWVSKPALLTNSVDFDLWDTLKFLEPLICVISEKNSGLLMLISCLDFDLFDWYFKKLHFEICTHSR